MAISITNLSNGSGSGTSKSISATTVTGDLYILVLEGYAQIPTVNNALGVTWSRVASWSETEDCYAVYQGTCTSGATGSFTATFKSGVFAYSLNQVSGYTVPTVPILQPTTQLCSYSTLSISLAAFQNVANPTFVVCSNDSSTSVNPTPKTGYTSLSTAGAMVCAWKNANDTSPNMTCGTSTDLLSGVAFEINTVSTGSLPILSAQVLAEDSANSSGNQSSRAVSVTTKTGALYLAHIDSGHASTPTISNGLGVTWTLLKSWNNNGDYYGVYYGVCTSGSSGSWTASFGASTFYSVCIIEFDGYSAWPSNPTLQATQTTSTSSPLSISLGSFQNSSSATFMIGGKDASAASYQWATKNGWVPLSMTGDDILLAWYNGNDASPDMTFSSTGLKLSGVAFEIHPVTNASISLSGVSATTAVGTAAGEVDVTASPSGVSVTSAVGSLTTTADGSVAVSGVSASSALGAATIEVDVVASVTGVSVVSAVGAASAGIDTTASPSGVSVASAIGTFNAIGAGVGVPAGVSATSAVGTATVTGAGNAVPVGVGTTAAVGTATIFAQSFAVPLGVSMTSALGSIGATNLTILYSLIGLANIYGMSAASILNSLWLSAISTKNTYGASQESLSNTIAVNTVSISN